MDPFVMRDQDFQTADALARALTGKADVNELAKCVGFLRDHSNSAEFFVYLDTVIAEGRAVVRSEQTLGYYQAIRDASRRHLAAYQDNPEVMAQILGWAARLMHYYAVTGEQAVPRQPFSRSTPAAARRPTPVAASQSVPVATGRQGGRVKFFNVERGFGFIEPDGGGQDVFVSQRNVPGGSLASGQRVTYTTVPGPKGPQARDVQSDQGRQP